MKDTICTFKYIKLYEYLNYYSNNNQMYVSIKYLTKIVALIPTMNKHIIKRIKYKLRFFLAKQKIKILSLRKWQNSYI